MNLNATMIGQTISFIFFVFFCVEYVWPTIINAINIRQKKIHSGLIFSDQAKKKLIEAKKIANKEINKAKKIALNIVQKAQKNKIFILDQAKFLAKKKEAEILKVAQKEIAFQHQKSFEILKKKVGNLAILIAEKLIQKSLEKVENEKIIKNFFSNLSNKNNNDI